MTRNALAFSPPLFLSALLLAACGGTVVFEEDGQGDGGDGGGGDGGAPTTGSTRSSGPGPTTSGVTTGGPTTTGPTTTGPTTTVGPTTNVSAVVGTPAVGICGTGVTLFSGAFDPCLANSCCAQFDDCTRQGQDVLGCQNCLDGFGGDCETALDCAAGCLPSGPECGSGLDLGPDAQFCLDDNCCAAELFCTSGGPRLDDCFECFDNGGGPRCDPLFECGGTFCSGGQQGVCDSGITFGDPGIDQCLSAACCDEFDECTSNGEDADACVDCLNNGSGALCDDAIACAEDNCIDLGGDGDGDGDADG